MIPASRAAQAYRRVESESRSPIELVVMLYDGLLRFVQEARDAHARGDIRTRGNAVSRAMAIISELQNTLDLDKGGEVADRLDNLYVYLTSRLLEVTLKQDPAPLDEIERLVVTLRDAWVQASMPPPPQGQGQAQATAGR